VVTVVVILDWEERLLKQKLSVYAVWQNSTTCVLTAIFQVNAGHVGEL